MLRALFAEMCDSVLSNPAQVRVREPAEMLSRNWAWPDPVRRRLNLDPKELLNPAPMLMLLATGTGYQREVVRLRRRYHNSRVPRQSELQHGCS